MMKALRNQKGFTLIEVMIGALILGMIILVWASLESFTAQVVKKASDFSVGQKVLLSITNDVLTSEKGLPPNEPPARLNKPNISRKDLEDTFVDLESKGAASILRKICYDEKANLITEASKLPLCYYNVAYFKFRVDDENYKGNDMMKQIPLSRLLIRVRYLDPDHQPNFDPKVKDKRYRTRYLARLVSNVAEF